MPSPARRRIIPRQRRTKIELPQNYRQMIHEIIMLREKRPYLRAVKSRIGIIGNEWFVLRVRWGAKVYRAFEDIGEKPATILKYEEIYLHETEPRLSTREINTLARKRLREAGIIIE